MVAEILSLTIQGHDTNWIEKRHHN